MKPKKMDLVSVQPSVGQKPETLATGQHHCEKRPRVLSDEAILWLVDPEPLVLNLITFNLQLSTDIDTNHGRC